MRIAAPAHCAGLWSNVLVGEIITAEATDGTTTWAVRIQSSVVSRCSGERGVNLGGGGAVDPQRSWHGLPLTSAEETWASAL
jgi:hypothetical protein